MRTCVCVYVYLCAWMESMRSDLHIKWWRPVFCFSTVFLWQIKTCVWLPPYIHAYIHTRCRWKLCRLVCWSSSSLTCGFLAWWQSSQIALTAKFARFVYMCVCVSVCLVSVWKLSQITLTAKETYIHTTWRFAWQDCCASVRAYKDTYVHTFNV